MKNRVIFGAAVLAIVVGATVCFWPRKTSEIDPQQLANQIAAGKTVQLPGGGTFVSQSPSNDYFALPAGPQRVAYLDKMIDEQETTRKKIASGEIKLPGGVDVTKHRAPSEGEMSIEQHTSVETKVAPADGSDPQGKPERKEVSIRLNADDLSPSFRAQMQEFHAALRARRKERGLDPDAPMMIIRTSHDTVAK